MGKDGISDPGKNVSVSNKSGKQFPEHGVREHYVRITVTLKDSAWKPNKLRIAQVRKAGVLEDSGGGKVRKRPV